MKFKNYLFESERTKPIDSEEVLYRLSEHCPKNLKCFLDGHELFRGTDNTNKYMIGDSNKGKPRKSANTENYYTLLIDNTKLWDKYPKRSRSFICSNYNSGYGSSLYYVIPYDGTKMGVCPDADIWNGFETVIGNNNLEGFNIVIKWVFKLNSHYADWKILKQAMNSGILSNDKKAIKWIEEIDFLKKYNKDMESGKKNIKVTDYWEKDFEPKKNGFKIIDSLSKIPAVKREIWFSGKAIFLEKQGYTFNDELQNELRNLL